MTEKFEMWALVELFGHTRLAGLVTEQTVAGGAMVRIDVPETDEMPGFTRIVNVSAIYAINPVTEDMARSLCKQLKVKAVQAWDIHEYITKNKSIPEKGVDTPYEDE